MHLPTIWTAFFPWLLYTRILFRSKLSSYKDSKKFLEPPNFDLQHIYRALDVIADESDLIQSTLYKNSLALSDRNTKVLYYDCTNFFEIEEEDDFRSRHSKEHRPNPLVQMGLFMDGDGVPLAFSITPGNTNEQKTLKPLEEQILSDFHLSKFVVCTDAGLSSTANRKFNDKDDRRFITTQSLKKLKPYLKEWASDCKQMEGGGLSRIIDISRLEDEKYLKELSQKEFSDGPWKG